MEKATATMEMIKLRGKNKLTKPTTTNKQEDDVFLSFSVHAR